MNNQSRIIVMLHRPFWQLNPASNWLLPALELREYWHEYFVDQGVDAVFNGHAHLFFHAVRNGTHYTTTGGGCAEFAAILDHVPAIADDLLPEDRYFTNEYHVCLVEATKAGYNVGVIVSNGTSVYNYFIEARYDEPTTTTTTTTSPTTTTTTTTTTTFPGVLAVLTVFGTLVVFTRRRKKM